MDCVVCLCLLPDPLASVPHGYPCTLVNPLGGGLVLLIGLVSWVPREVTWSKALSEKPQLQACLYGGAPASL